MSTTIIPDGAAFNFTGLSLDQSRYIIAIIGEKPLNQVHALWSLLNGQLAAQLQPSPPAPATVPEQVSEKTPVADAATDALR